MDPQEPAGIEISGGKRPRSPPMPAAASAAASSASLAPAASSKAAPAMEPAPEPSKRTPAAPKTPPSAAASAAKAIHPVRAPLHFRAVTDGETIATLRKTVLSLVFGAKPFKSSTYLGARPEIPGPLACALTRVSLTESLAKMPYSVCEKSDGERRLMLITSYSDASPGVYLVDRSFSFQALDGTISCGSTRPAEPISRVISRAVSRSGPTLIDGELVVRPGRAELGPSGAVPTNVFLVFDAVCVGGKRVAEAPLQQRLGAIGTGVRQPLRADDDSRLKARLPLLPLLILGKVFRPAKDLMSVLSKVEQWPSHLAPPPPGELQQAAQGSAAASSSADSGGPSAVGRATISVYVDGQRVNGNDGLVFTPERPGYLDLLTMPDKAAPGSTVPVQPLLKWKPLHENTVDFVVNKTELERAKRARAGEATTVSLSAREGRKGHTEMTTARIMPEAATELLKVMLGAGKTAELVVECAADEHAAPMVLRAHIGAAAVGAIAPEQRFAAALRASWESRRFYPRWTVMRARTEKSRANSTLTAWSTLEVLADNVTPLEITGVLAKCAAPRS